MGTNTTLPYLFLLFTTISVAQSRKQIQGKIFVRDASSSGVLILNLSTQQETKSTDEGLFTILAKSDDVLVFSAEHLEFMRKIVEDADLDQQIVVELTSKRIVLDEVEIKAYNAVDLGILQKSAKSYTPAERRLKTAGDFKPIHLLAIIGGGMPLDPVFNAINGKTKRLKKEIKLERNQIRLQQFQSFISNEELISQVKVDRDEVMDFTFFVLEKEEFINLLTLRDKNKMLFYLIQMHHEFKNQNQSNE